MKRRFLNLLLLMCLSPVVKAQEDAFTAVANMRVGWNLGNSLDSNSGDVKNMWIEQWTSRTPADYEKAWGQPVTTKALIHMFKEAGFNAIRVPVTWYPHFGNLNRNGLNWDPAKWTGYTVNAAWMKRVHEIVDYVIDEGMYCILNVHHDTGASSTAWLRAETTTYNAQRQRYETLWKAIANEFKDYGDKLLFESYNEMLDKYNSWCFASFAAPGNYNATVAADAYKAINSYAQSFVDVVRATGGKNAQRNLVVNTYGACDGHGTWNSHLLDPLKQMALPSDEAGEGHIIFQVHSYWDTNNYNASMRSEITSTMSNLNTYLIKKHNAPVIIGEWGSSSEWNASNQSQVKNLTDFASYFTEKAKARGITCFYWMELADGKDRATPTWTHPWLKEAVIKGYYGEGGYVDGIEEIEDRELKMADGEAAMERDAIYSLTGMRLSGKPAKGHPYIKGGRIIIAQ